MCALRNARPIGADQHADVVGVPADEQTRELGAELLLEYGNRIATRHAEQSQGLGRTNAIIRTPAD